ncbi:MAG: PD-(D/E)XK nuclease family protein [Acidimicrobiales bacterium]
MIQATQVVDLASIRVAEDHPGRDDVAELRAELGARLSEATTGWDRPAGLLGITKGRMFSTRRCPASVCGELAPRTLGHDLAVGTIVDTAAALLATSATIPGRASWLDALLVVLRETEPELAQAVADLPIDVRDELRTVVHERCDALRGVLGDLTGVDVTAQERARVIFDGPGVSLSGRSDLVVGAASSPRSIVEVKSGSVRPSHIDELGFYALLFALRDGVAPAAVAAVTLDPPIISAHAVTWDLLEGVALRIVETAATLIEVDRTIAGGAWPETRPGQACSWCGAAPRCPDAPDIAIAERDARVETWVRPAGSSGDDLGDLAEPIDADDDEEPW